MMPDLGKYGATVLGAYGQSLVLIGLLVVWVLWRSKAVRTALARAEARGAAARGAGRDG